MKGVDCLHLNPDCVRDILVTVEENEFGNSLSLSTLVELLPAYTEDELTYACLKLNEGDLLDVLTVNAIGLTHPAIVEIKELTFYGHEFLDNIKSDNVWNKTKQVAKGVGSFSLQTIKDISTAVISDLIKSNF